MGLLNGAGAKTFRVSRMNPCDVKNLGHPERDGYDRFHEALDGSRCSF